MILDLSHFLSQERPYWQELEKILMRLANDPQRVMTVNEISRLYYLYQRASADLVKLNTFATENALKVYLEQLVANAYTEIHGGKRNKRRFNPFIWFWYTFPQTFRRQSRAFVFSLLVTLVGAGFGAAMLQFAPDAKQVILPFGHLLGDPSERVAEEEASVNEALDDGKTYFSATLMTHNTKVAIFTMASGLSWGIMTIIILFYNGVILGLVSVDYILAGELVFLAGWLLPHGVIEIPAILIGGQAGFVLARALIGWGSRETMRTRLRKILPDLATLIMGVGIMLVWAGIIEAFLSQYHAPVLPYSVKIIFGLVELIALIMFLKYAGRPKSSDNSQGVTA